MLTDTLKRTLRGLWHAFDPGARSVSPGSRPALNQLDVKLERYLDFDCGVFVEAGANDGYTQSNTYYFEKHRGWTGVLIEGIPELAERCRALRTHSQVFNCGLVREGYPNPHVTMHYANLMSIVEGARGNAEHDRAFVKEGMSIQHLGETFTINVPARTLTSVLDESRVRSIDLLSLDVEGYELEVLRGLDFRRYRPTYICIEVWDPSGIDELLHPYYTAIAQLTKFDVLYKAT